MGAMDNMTSEQRDRLKELSMKEQNGELDDDGMRELKELRGESENM